MINQKENYHQYTKKINWIIVLMEISVFLQTRAEIPSLIYIACVVHLKQLLFLQGW